MAINNIQLNTLLKLLYLPDNGLRSELRKDIRMELKKELGQTSGGGHFYTPFWSDVKLHVLGQGDLHELTAARIAKDRNKKKLYPLLEAGFLKLWQRGSNQQVKVLDKSPKGKFEAENTELVIKVENIMAISINGQERLGYPYWFPNPALSKEAARIGLWVMTQALKDQDPNSIRIFDIIRSEFFSLSLLPLEGNEEKTLLHNFDRISKMREKLKLEY